MWEISAAVRVNARHQIRIVSPTGNEEGAVHAHRWRIRAVVRAEQLDATGWVLDFGELAGALRALVAPYDGAFINDVAPFDDVNPTRENVARFLADTLADKLDDGRARVHSVEIWEDDVCCATYLRPSV
jgi:6-pyruvoyltetrahydropterin/6-carboxytetrahydropterin synthase